MKSVIREANRHSKFYIFEAYEVIFIRLLTEPSMQTMRLLKLFQDP